MLTRSTPVTGTAGHAGCDPGPSSGATSPPLRPALRQRCCHAQQAPSPQAAPSTPQNALQRPGVARLVAQAVEQGLPLVVTNETTLRAVASLIRPRSRQ